MNDKFSPTPADWQETLDALKSEAADGRLKAIVFVLVDARMPDQAMIDALGAPDVMEIACRKTVEELALAQEMAGNKVLAKAIREGMVQPRIRH